MKKPRRTSLPADNDLIKLTPEELAFFKAQDARRQQPRFPLNLTATLAQQFVPRGTPDAAEHAVYREAARRAIMLLDACQEELLKDAGAHVFKEVRARQETATVAKRQNLERQCHNGVMPFKKGLQFITRQRSHTEAIPLFKRWRRGIRERPDVFPHLVGVEQSSDIEAALLKELEQFRNTGFDLNTLEQFQISFATWYEEYELPSIRAKAGRTGGTRPRRKKI